MSNVFFIGDTHFGHPAIINFEAANRPFKTIEEHDNELIRRWNDRIGKRDVVWHLGDVAWTEDALYQCLPQLNGRIKLVMGNHDTFSIDLYRALGIDSFYACVQWKHDILLTHMPTWLGDRYAWNYHGHMHSLSMPDSWPGHICLSAEQTGLAPIAHDELPHHPKRAFV